MIDVSTVVKWVILCEIFNTIALGMWPKLNRVLAIPSSVGLNRIYICFKPAKFSILKGSR